MTSTSENTPLAKQKRGARLSEGSHMPSRSSAPLPENTPLAKQKRGARLRMLFLVVLLVVVLVASACIGQFSVSVPDLFKVLTGQASAVSGQVATILTEVRLPRVILCAFIGAALSIAGAAYQGLFQNPMCSQDVLGASSGASFGAALAILLGLTGAGISSFAFIFGLLAVAIATGVSQISKTNRILALILSGMVVSSLFSSGVSAIKLVADTDQVLPAITYWLMGSLTGIRSSDVLPTAGLLVLASAPIWFLRWRINLLATGEDEAKSLGVNTTLVRLIIICAATFLTATCVSVSGLIGWVGLVIPHFVRLFLGNDYRKVIPASMLMGASFLLVVDDLARMLTTSEIPIGILTSFVGAPVFLLLIKRGGASRGRKS